ncbi:hypothetical protein PILCRDRAFT_9796 [Piloderma croceum F 1598]|uniref:F-box domain-containing protein n=1 Tax=Piloderma croceum (strain F 1598) TaxID=765440 RepID=A0A0C3BSF4_PILCF|nr:hypothetical protein PILCRDRAFT_9796 [Piloderma croceum F 1598]
MSLQKNPSLKQFFPAKHRVACAPHSSQPPLKRKRSFSSQDRPIAKRFSTSRPCILVLPTETIENICLLVDESDGLKSLTRVNRLFASIACPIYVTKLGIHVRDTSRLVHTHSESFRALAIWHRSRLFPYLEDKILVCDINDSDIKFTNQQTRALRHFLSAPFIGRPFLAIHINSADALSPPEILQFIQLIDGAGCQTATISSGFMNPDWLEIAVNSCSLKLAAVSVCHLRTLDIDNQYFSPRQWSYLLQHLTGPELESICIRGQLSISAMFKFLSRHPHISRLRLHSCWGAHDQCIKPIKSLLEIQMPNLSEIEGPPCYVRALLKCILPTSPTLTIKMACDQAMTYPQYVRAVLCSMGQCRAPVRLEIRLTFFYHPLLDPKGLKSLCTIPLPQVTSLEISFPPTSESQILACCTQWFTLIPMLRRMEVYVGSAKRRRLSSKNVVAGPRGGIAVYTSGRARVEWDADSDCI